MMISRTLESVRVATLLLLATGASTATSASHGAAYACRGSCATCAPALDQVCAFEFGSACQQCAALHQAGLRAAGCVNSDLQYLCQSPVQVTHSVARLSVARRDVSAVSLGDKAYFAGGCTDTGTGVATQYICDSASAAVDVFEGAGAHLSTTLTLSEPKGWVAACTADQQVVFVGGGTGGAVPHSRSADVWTPATGNMVPFPQALPQGRWGIGCASIRKDRKAFFTGGKYLSGSQGIFSPQINAYSAASQSWSVSPSVLSVARESTTAVECAGELLVAGGWYEAASGRAASDIVDSFSANSHHAINMKSAAFDMGATAMADGSAVVVGDTDLFIFNGTQYRSVALPPKLAGQSGSRDTGGAVPGAHVAQNGVTIGGTLACFYGLSPAAGVNGIYCYDTQKTRWWGVEGNTTHKSGGIAAVGNTLMLGGGFDPASTVFAPTDVVDVYDFQVMFPTSS